MLKIEALHAEDAAKHFAILSARFYDGLAAGLGELDPDADAYDRELLEYLDDSLKDILIGSPAKLERIAMTVRRRFPAFSAYAARKNKGEDAADLVHRHTLKIVKACFDYDKFLAKGLGWNAYALVCAHDLRICPYCHAHHVNYHVDPEADSVAKQYRIRAPLDHFLPKSSYPYLAVSLYNLVPSCAQCNSSIKSAADPLELGLSSPHDRATEIAIRFSAAGSIPDIFKGTVDDIKIDLLSDHAPSTALIDAFLLRERYQWYRHEVKDLIDRYYEHLAIPPTLRPYVSKERFVLGCSEARADSRMIGFCLRDIYRQLMAMEVA